MNQNYIHDALNFLDDDMIQATDTLRLQKRDHKNKLIWISRAACLCLIAAALYLLIPIFTVPEKTDSSFGTSSQNKTSISPEEPSCSSADPFSADSESAEPPQKEAAAENLEDVSLVITGLTEDGFTGIITEIWNGGLSAGQTVDVLFGDALPPESLSSFQVGTNVRIHCVIDEASGRLTACELISVKP